MSENLLALSTEFTITDIVNVFIAIITLVLAYYVFVYQKQQDKKQINIQWFKELIILPKFHYIEEFYDNIYNINTLFNDSDLTNDQRIEIMSILKRERDILKRSFIDILLKTAPDLFNTIQINIDELIDGITNTIDNDELKLNNPKTFEREIRMKITSSYSNLLISIFNYKK